MGFNLSNRQSFETSSPPPVWEAPQLADAKHLPHNTRRDQMKRRFAAGAEHTDETQHPSADGRLWYIYTDVATVDGWIEIVWHCTNTDRNEAKLSCWKRSLHKEQNSVPFLMRSLSVLVI